MRTDMKRAASLGPAAGNTDQTIDYRGPIPVSRPDLLERAGDLLLLLLRQDLSRGERAGFNYLFERRLRRAYEGGRP